jgi:hypothetical protein
MPDVWLWSWYRHSVEKDGWAGWQANKTKSEEGMKQGTLIHAEIESLIAAKSADVSNEAQSLYDAVSMTVDEWVAIEPHLICNAHKFAGTADMIVRQSYSPGLWVGDWKTSFHKSDSHPLQLAAYAMAWNENNPDRAIDQGFIARVDKKSDECRVKIDEYLGLKKYFPVILALRQMWDYTEHEGIWKKEKKVKISKNE